MVEAIKNSKNSLSSLKAALKFSPELKTKKEPKVDYRDSGIEVIGKVSWGTHFSQFYQTKKDLVDILVPFFKAGLERNEFCMWITSDLLNKKEVKEVVNSIPKLKEYLDKGQIEVLSCDEWYLKNGSFDSKRVLNGWIRMLNQALEKGYEGLRLTGNPFWLEKATWKDFLDYENTVNEVIGDYKIIANCTYSLEKCNASEIIDVVSTHQFALIKRSGKWELIESSDYKKTKEALKNERFMIIKERDKAREAENEILISQHFLEIANRQVDFESLLNEFVKEIGVLTGCEAIGIRLLDESSKIPYSAYVGFSRNFYEKESPLSIKSDNCMCINVIKGSADPNLSYYTENGSFYMNGTSKFLATTSEEEKGMTRNICNQFGYESVALIPIRTRTSIIGLIHVADCKENMVSLKLVRLLERISNVFGIAIQRASAHEKLVKAYESEHIIAQTLQRSLLTEDIPKVEGLEIEYFYQSATYGAEVGGDFYDIFAIPGKGFGLAIGDVSGKGILAAAQTTKIKHLLRDRAYEGIKPSEVIASVNEALLRQQYSTGGTFTALTFGLYDPKTSTLNLSNAGNPYPYLAKVDRFLEVTGVPVSINTHEKYNSVKLKLEKGEILLMYTDGLTDSRNNGELFGEEGIRKYMKKNVGTGLKPAPALKKLIHGLVEESRKFSHDNLTDDILVIGVKKI